MISDVVIDTNVMLHAGNPNDQYFNDSISLLNKLLESETLLCMDEGFDFDEAKNTSKLGYEYIVHIRSGMLAYVVLQKLALSRRIKFVDLKLRPEVRRRVNQLIRNQRDRTFLIVAIKSSEKILVTHDFNDFQVPKRKTINNDLNVVVLIARECYDRMV
jgi:predicted nucleic acid-binding protein